MPPAAPRPITLPTLPHFSASSSEPRISRELCLHMFFPCLHCPLTSQPPPGCILAIFATKMALGSPSVTSVCQQTLLLHHCLTHPSPSERAHHSLFPKALSFNLFLVLCLFLSDCGCAFFCFSLLSDLWISDSQTWHY